jgi:hypothetical protein
VLINLTTGPGARFVPGDEDPQKPGPGTTIGSPGRARPARGHGDPRSGEDELREQRRPG